MVEAKDSGGRNAPSSPTVTTTTPDAAASPRVATETTAAPTPAAAPAESAAHVSRDSTETGNVAGKAARRIDAADSGGIGIDRGSIGSSSSGVDGQAGNPAFDMVVAQLCRVVAGCSQLLVLRGVIGEQEERALSVMSSRGSPVLLAAVEAYGANQDLEVRARCPFLVPCVFLAVVGVPSVVLLGDVRGRYNKHQPCTLVWRCGRESNGFCKTFEVVTDTLGVTSSPH